MGTAVLDTWIGSICHTLHCEISALEDFNVASVPCWPSQVDRITGTPCTTWNTMSHWMWTTHIHTYAYMHAHGHTPPGVPITVSVPVPLLTLSCRLLNVQEYCPASLVYSYHRDEQSCSPRVNMVLGSGGDIQRGSIVPPLHSGVRGNSVLIREAVKKGKAIFKDSEVSWSSDW